MVLYSLNEKVGSSFVGCIDYSSSLRLMRGRFVGAVYQLTPVLVPFSRVAIRVLQTLSDP